jgi:hypothetical protein
MGDTSLPTPEGLSLPSAPVHGVAGGQNGQGQALPLPPTRRRHDGSQLGISTEGRHGWELGALDTVCSHHQAGTADALPEATVGRR